MFARRFIQMPSSKKKPASKSCSEPVETNLYSDTLSFKDSFCCYSLVCVAVYCMSLNMLQPRETKEVSLAFPFSVLLYHFVQSRCRFLQRDVRRK